MNRQDISFAPSSFLTRNSHGYAPTNDDTRQSDIVSPATITDHDSGMLKIIKAILAYRGLVKSVTMIGFVVLFSLLALSAPNYEWDLLAYIANASHIVTGLPAEALHAPIYENLKLSIPPYNYDKMVGAPYDNMLGSPSRQVLSQDPEAFRQTVSFFYDSRVVYTYILAAFIEMGFNPVTASYAFSTTCAVLSALLLSQLIPVKVPLGVYFVLPFIALSCGLLTVARLASPDALATLATIVLYYLLIRNRVPALLLLLPFMIFIRTDLILLTGLFFLYFFLNNRISKVAVVASAVATVAAYLMLNYVVVESDPWTSLIGYNFGDKPTHPQEFNFTVSVAEYITYIIQGLKSFSYNPIFFVFCMLSVTGIVLFSARFFFNHDNARVSQQHADILFLFVSCVAYLAIHFVLFPVTWTRFFAAQYSLVAVVVVWATLAILAERNYSARESMDLLNR